MSLVRLLVLVLLLAAPLAAHAADAPFDLAGPALDVEVTRGGATLPIAEVPSLAEGDRIGVRPDFPAGESAHYLLVAAFLKGAADPPPPAWFHAVPAWGPRAGAGLDLVVPAGAQEVVLFLAPRAGGGLRTLVGAVRGRPGAFVRASQDLDQAALDHARLEAFIEGLRQAAPADPAGLKRTATLLARSLMVKLDDHCFARMPELQAACLMQDQDQLVLDDGHATSIVEALTSGAPQDLAMQLSATPQAGFGYFSPYVAAVMDIARILDSLHTPHFQYLPAVPAESGDRISLLLNAAPSFHDPLSVLVTALPAVAPAQPPPLRPVEPAAANCAQHPDLVLAVSGAPLVFATGYARDLALRLTDAAGHPLSLPVRADALRGGLVVAGALPAAGALGPEAQAQLEGRWGFGAFTGPTFRLASSSPAALAVADADRRALVVGRSDQISLEGPAAPCVAGVTLQTAAGERPLAWKAAAPDRIAVTVPLQDAAPGEATLKIRLYGAAAPVLAPLTAYAEPARLAAFEIHAGDAFAALQGARLDEVAGASFDGLAFTPGGLESAGGADRLALRATDPTSAALLKPGGAGLLRVLLKDGRTRSLAAVVGSPRPQASLIAISVSEATSAAPLEASAPSIELDPTAGAPADAPAGSRLAFSVRAEGGARVSGRTRIEVATADGVATATLAPGSGLAIEDDQVAVASLEPAAALGPQAYGPLKFRLGQDGAWGDWRPLATVVRLPRLTGFSCAGQGPQPCALRGEGLFLIASLAASPAFAAAVQPPPGYVAGALAAPRPLGGRLYVRLRDDPAALGVIDVRAPDPPRPKVR